MNRFFPRVTTKLVWAAILLVPVLALGQGSLEGSGAGGLGNEQEKHPATQESAGTKSPWRLRFDLAWIDPSGHLISAGTAESAIVTGFSTGFGAGLRVEYLLAARFGVEVGVLGAGSVDIGAQIYGGSFRSDVEVSGFVPLTLGLNVHLTPGHRADLYAGPLLALVNYSNVDVWTGSGVVGTAVSVDDDVGWGAILGLDIPVGEHGWLVQANVRYIETDMENSGDAFSFDSEFDPVMISVGFGYRF